MQSPPKKLLDQVRDVLRLKHYAYRTEETYGQIRRHILFHNKRHPNEMGNALIRESSALNASSTDSIAPPQKQRILTIVSVRLCCPGFYFMLCHAGVFTDTQSHQ
ncbi:MAG TPA: phage integrase N-terminal SAM-like domain-containing protein [Coleofasciculaceae cyanobacterium]